MDNIQNYINQFDKLTQDKLNTLRKTIMTCAPDSIEKISWGVPTYNNHGFLVQFAVNKNHIGFYCSPEAINKFQTQLQGYKTNTKNTIQFLHSQDIPYQLIHDITLFCLETNKKNTP